MSHNPHTVKSQDELGRTMTLLRAIEQLEKTECELEKVEKQLHIAVETLKDVIEKDMYNLDEHRAFIEQKLEEIKKVS